MAAQPAAAAAYNQELQPALLEVTVNGQRAQEVLVLRGGDGAIYVELKTLQEWRLSSAFHEAIEVAGQRYVALSGVQGLSFGLDEERQTMVVEVDSARMERNVLAASPNDLGPMTGSGWGGFVNYELVAEFDGRSAVLNGALEAVAFSPMGAVTSSFAAQSADTGFRATRLETNWTIDDPAKMRSLRLGDSISRGGIGGGPVRFGGIQLARNFAVEPGFVTLPLPSINGSAALPSVIDVYVNNLLQQRREVRPGPFQILDLPIVTGNGEVQLIVRDMLGREAVVRESYYATSQLLRPGLHDYSYELGFLRRNFGQESNNYAAMFAAATHRVGLSSRLTGEVHAEASGDVQAAGLAATWLLPTLGVVNLGAAVSRSERGDGALVKAAFERRTPGFSFGVGAELATDAFTSIGFGPDESRPSSVIRAFVGAPVSFGSVGFSYVRLDERGTPSVELLNATASMRLGNFGSLHLSGRHSSGQVSDTSVELLLAMPLGRRTHANAGLSLRDGGVSMTAGLHQSLPVGEGLGYRVSATTGLFDRVDARLDVNLDFAQFSAELTWTDARSGARIVASGSVGLVDGHAFAARRLGQSFAVVRTGNYPNVRVYADNQLVGRTNRDGTIIVPRLRPYERNVVRFDMEDVPLDAQVAVSERSVRPYNRSGVAVDFPVHASRGAVVGVRLEDGAPLPAGSILRVGRGTEEFVSGPGGEVYLAGLDGSTSVRAEHPGGSCHFEMRLHDTSDPQPRLGEVICAAGTPGDGD